MITTKGLGHPLFVLLLKSAVTWAHILKDKTIEAISNKYFTLTI
jgi:hypothetical protein